MYELFWYKRYVKHVQILMEVWSKIPFYVISFRSCKIHLIFCHKQKHGRSKDMIVGGKMLRILNLAFVRRCTTHAILELHIF